MRIAIVGAGISGLVAARLLAEDHQVVVFESNDYPGGHTNTVDVPRREGRYAVDTGFIVFNERTYPNFIKLLEKLGVPWQDSTMSFSVKCGRTGVEFSPSTFRSLFAQPGNLLRSSFHRMLADVFRFRRDSEKLLRDNNEEVTLEDYLRRSRYSKGFMDWFIIPMGAAIWSTDPGRFRRFPARYFTGFFKNHGILQLRNQPRWLVVRGGSKQYVAPLTRPFRKDIRLSCPVASIRRNDDHVEVTPQGEPPEKFDHVIIATHSDQALSILADPSEAERRVLGAIPYQPNQAVLHTDHSVLPRRRAAWASWNYYIPPLETDRVVLTYDMNRLQSLEAPVRFCVTLNDPGIVAPQTVVRKILYHHPLYTPEGLEARKNWKAISGVRRTHYCGAYWGYGFHEDGVKSALSVCRFFGKSLES